MNILPHKSWHVRTKKNIARVRRDEEKARQEDAEKQKRIKLAENEARIALLRSQHSTLQDNNKTTTTTTTRPEGDHFDLFDNHKDKTLKDSEKEFENKIEQEKWEVKAGIFSYLDGRYKHDQNKNDQWYMEVPVHRTSTVNEAQSVVDEKVKRRHDPLEDMRKLLKDGKSSFESKEKQFQTSGQITSAMSKQIKTVKQEEESNYLPNLQLDKRKRKKMKHKHHKHKTHRDKSSSDSSSSDNEQQQDKKRALLDKLRQERLIREHKERARTKLLLQGPDAIVNAVNEQTHRQRYNSQFNPHIARQNQPTNEKPINKLW